VPISAAKCHNRRDYTAVQFSRFFAQEIADLSVEPRDYAANLRVNDIVVWQRAAWFGPSMFKTDVEIIAQVLICVIFSPSVKS
jgi:hypothetical protein